MSHEPAYGLWSLVVINTAVFVLFAFSFARPRSARDWRFEGRGTGVVRGIDTAKAQITLEHGDVPGLMQAMTMTFDVADPKLLEGIEVGDEVGFSLRYADGSYTVTDLRPR